MSPDDDLDPIRARFEKLAWTLDERTRRLFAAAEASVLGHGGVSKVARALGVSRRAIHAGLLELSALTGKDAPDQQRQRVRREGGGRKSVRATDAALLAELRKLVEAPGQGEPDAPLRWTGKSLRTLAAELSAAGFPVSHLTVGNLMGQLGYNLQPNRRLAAGADHPDRNAQFAFINHQVVTRLQAGDPVIAVDTRKKERQARAPADGAPEPARAPGPGAAEAGFDHPFGPAGADDADGGGGWLGVARDHETASFGVECIRRWWHTMGRQRYPGASELMITADGGASGGRRVRLWKLELQRLADEIRLPIHVSHLPPATNKWNRVEHRLFSSVNMSWRGRPEVRHEVAISLIAGTITRKGLKPVDAAAGDGADEAGEARFEHIHLTRSAFHGEWNYRIDPELAA